VTGWGGGNAFHGWLLRAEARISDFFWGVTPLPFTSRLATFFVTQVIFYLCKFQKYRDFFRNQFRKNRDIFGKVCLRIAAKTTPLPFTSRFATVFFVSPAG